MSLDLFKNPTDWFNGLAVVEKPYGKLDLNPTLLNKTITVNMNTYISPLPTKSSPRSQGYLIFSKLDASSGYWQIKVDEQS